MPYPLLFHLPVAGLVPVLCREVGQRLAEQLNGFQFLSHGIHVVGVRLLLDGQQVDLALSCLGGDLLVSHG